MKGSRALALACCSAVLFAAVCLGGQLKVYAAADGWTKERSNWYYYANGRQVENEWRKGDSGNWFYLGDDGAMLTNSWVDSEYYVNEQGAMVREEWRKLYRPGDDENDVESEERWFYFQGTGKCVSDTWKKIYGKWYHFEDDGAMSYGWYDQGNYYLGSIDDGAMKSGWLYLEDDETMTRDIGESWYWFNSSGEKASEVVDKKIAGKYYCFDKLGRMLYGWVDVNALLKEDENGASNSLSDYQYYGAEDDGARVTGWRQMEGPENYFGDSDETSWFYFKDGKPFFADDGLELVIATINGQKYCFNQYGELQYGLQEIVYTDKDGNEELKTYYFGKKGDGAMKTGKQNVDNEEDGGTDVYYFTTGGTRKGQGITDIRDGCIYLDGKRLDADKSLRYQVVTNGIDTCLVNTSGKIQKAPEGKEKTFKDADGNVFTVNDKGEVVS